MNFIGEGEAISLDKILNAEMEVTSNKADERIIYALNDGFLFSKNEIHIKTDCSCKCEQTYEGIESL